MGQRNSHQCDHQSMFSQNSIVWRGVISFRREREILCFSDHLNWAVQSQKGFGNAKRPRSGYKIYIHSIRFWLMLSIFNCLGGLQLVAIEIEACASPDTYIMVTLYISKIYILVHTVNIVCYNYLPSQPNNIYIL